MVPAGSDDSVVVLEEAISEDYEPSQQEIIEYAEWMDIDHVKDPELLWIAKTGLKAPLPHPWKACHTGDDDEIFYFNFETGESVWDHPSDEHYKELFQKEYAKKYGRQPPSADEPNKSPSGAGADTTPRNSSNGEEEKKDIKSKKDEKRDKKDKTNPKELAPLNVPLAKKFGLGVGLAVGRRASADRDLDLESSLEDSLDAGGSSCPSTQKQCVAGGRTEKSPKDESGTTTLPNSSELKSWEEALGGSLGSSGSLLPVAEDPSHIVEGNASSEKNEAKIKKDLEAVRSRLEKELQEWTIKEEAKQQHEQEQKKAAIEAEIKSKLEQHRRNLEEQFEMEKDKFFSDLQTKNDRDVNEEKQRLKKALASQKCILQTEVDKECEALALKVAEMTALTELCNKCQEELDQLNEANTKLEQELKQAKAEAVASAAEAAESMEKLKSWETEMQKLRTTASADEALKKTLLDEIEGLSKELLDAKNETRMKQQECERLRSENATNASGDEEIKHLQRKLADEETQQARAASEHEELKESLAKSENLSSECAEHVEKARRFEDDNAQLLKEVAEQEIQIGKAREVQEQLKEKETDLGRVSAELVAAKETVIALLEATATEQKSSEAAQKEIAQLRADAESAECLREKEQELQTLRSLLECARSDLARSSEESSMHMSEISTLQFKLHSKREESEYLREAASANTREYEINLEQAQHECQRLRDDAAKNANSALESMQYLQNIYDEERRRAAQAKVDASQELAGLRAEIGAKTVECESLAKIAEASNRSIVDVRNLQSQLAVERSESAHAKIEAASASRELAALKIEVGAISKECDSLKAKEASNSREAQGDLLRIQAKSTAQLREAQDELHRARSQAAARDKEMMVLRIESDAKDAECKRVQERSAEYSRVAAEEIRSLKSQLEEERSGAAQSVAGAASSSCELSSRRAEMMAISAVAEDARKLEKELDEERRGSASLRAGAALTSYQLATLRAELEAKIAECGRLRAETSNGTGMVPEEVRRLYSQLENQLEAFAKLKVEASVSARELLVGRTELESLQHHAIRPGSEEERSLRCLVREREDDIFRLKSDNAEAVAVHAIEMDHFQARLAELRARHNENQNQTTNDTQVQLRERASEIEKLRAELQSSASEVERLRYEARSLEIHAAASEKAAVESAKASSAEQHRREVKRMEDLVRQRDTDIVAAKDQVERAQREIRRLQVDEHRSVQRLEETRTDLERNRQESQQLREDNAEIERRLEDARTALRGEHAARNHAEGQAREAQREVKDLRESVLHQSHEMETLVNEARRERQAVANSVAEMSRLQEQIHSKEIELRQVRSAAEVASHQSDVVLRRRSADLSNREHALDDREQQLSERETFVAEAEIALQKRGCECRQDHESVGQSTTGELAVVGSQRTQDSTAVLWNSSPRQNQLEDANSALIVAISRPDSDQVGHPARVSSEEFGMVDVGVEKNVPAIAGLYGGAHLACPFASPPEVSVKEDTVATLDSRRRALRHERAYLEELQKMWESDLQRVHSNGGNIEAQTVLFDIKAVLDGRTASLNKLIEEHMVLERAISVHRSPFLQKNNLIDADNTDLSGMAPPRVNADTGVVVSPKASPAQENSLLLRWQHLLPPSITTVPRRARSPRLAVSATPRGTIGERNLAQFNHKATASRIVVDQHLNWLRGFQREVSGGSLSARGAPRSGMS